MNKNICCVVAALALAACGQVEPLDGNRIVSLADAGPAPVRGAGAPADAGVVKPDTGASDAGPRNDDHSDARVGGSRLAPGQGIAGVLDGDDDADWFVFTAGAGDLHRVETRGETDTKCALFDAQGEAVADDDDGGDGLNCRMEEALERALIISSRWSILAARGREVTRFLSRSWRRRVSSLSCEPSPPPPQRVRFWADGEWFQRRRPSAL